MKVLVLVDGLHSREMLAALSRLVDLSATEVILAYVSGPGPRAGLDLVRRRPGAGPLPPDRDRELWEAEAAAGGEAISDAEAAARAHGASTESIQVGGEPGRAICELADQRGADLVVVRAGGRDRPPVGGPALGPAARYIADHCSAPVLLLRTR